MTLSAIQTEKERGKWEQSFESVLFFVVNADVSTDNTQLVMATVITSVNFSVLGYL